MALTINTNLSSIIAQRNLANATGSLDKAIERMTTGYKINRAADNAAGYSIAKNWETQLSSLDVAADNAATGADMLSTLEDNYSLINSHLQRVRDLTEQAANGTYGTESLKAIRSEIDARLQEVDRIAGNCEFNGINLMDGSKTTDVNLQVGINANGQISLERDMFADATITGLFKGNVPSAINTVLSDDNKTIDQKRAELADHFSGVTADGVAVAANKPVDMLEYLDKVMGKISERVTKLGAAQNRIDSAIESINVQTENITSSLSTLRDADIAGESSKFLQAQILQQAAATLLSTANQAPSIALNLL